ncbi:MAG TPA: NADH-quinone oxidoreductase subunit I [Kofleriaceae bacterium]|nr:NADH-quinone oxidoreductase subunit I [Kofleriaceae bacterium]
MSAAHDDHGHGHGHAEAHEGPIVVAVSDRHPRVRTIQVSRPGQQDVNYLAATTKGLGITLKHFAKNLVAPLRKLSSRSRAGAPPLEESNQSAIETVQYPEEKVVYPERFRGLHRLMLRDDGAVRCVACMCCPTVCPAHCITIVPEESDAKGIEKRPAIFEIDELRCVVCGLCVEACPCDAIRMDTGMHAKPVEDRANAIETKDSMMGRGIVSIAKQGGEGPAWREHLPAPKDVNR